MTEGIASQSRAQTLQDGADGLERVGILRARRLPRFLKQRPLAEAACPLDVGLANEFLDQIRRLKKACHVRGQHLQRLGCVLEQKIAVLDAAKQDDRQHARWVADVLAKIELDFK